MRVLIDECVDPRGKNLFPGHIIATVHDRGWDALEDAGLLAAAQSDFDVLLTIDRGIEFQQNIARLRIGIVIAHVSKNQLIHYRVIEKELLAAIDQTRPGLAHIGRSRSHLGLL